MQSVEERGLFPLSLMVVVEAEALMALLLALLVLIFMETFWVACKFIKINEKKYFVYIWPPFAALLEQYFSKYEVL